VIISGDDKADDKWETAFEVWLPEFWKVTKAPVAPDEHEIPAPIVELEVVPNKEDTHYVQGRKLI
jgi:hypothetical protein